MRLSRVLARVACGVTALVFLGVQLSCAGNGGTGPGVTTGVCATVASSPPPAGRPDSIYIAGAHPPSCQLTCVAGSNLPLTALVKDATGALLRNETVNWTSSDSNTVNVHPQGFTSSGYTAVINCFQPGTATVFASDGTLEVAAIVLSQ